MGGRGSSSDITTTTPAQPRTPTPDEQIAQDTGGVITSATARTIDTIMRNRTGMGLRSTGYSYDDEVLEATADSQGNVTFSYARNGTYSPTARTNVRVPVSFDIVAGAVNGKTFNIDWSKVNSIRGQTYSLRAAAKAAGLKWDNQQRMWKR